MKDTQYINIVGFDNSPEKRRDRYALAGIADRFSLTKGIDWEWSWSGILIMLDKERNVSKSAIDGILDTCDECGLQVEVK